MMNFHGALGKNFSRNMKTAGRLLQFTILALLVCACNTTQATLTSLPFFPTYTDTPHSASSPTTPATPTIIPPTQLPKTPAITPSSTATISPDPMLFVYPSDEPIPIASWRPPLYPTPWAPTLFDHFYFASPIDANEVNIPVFDYRYGGMFFEDIVHTGIDIPAPRGTPIKAAGAGTVIWAGYGVYKGGYDTTDPYGLAVTIQHDFGYHNQPLFTIYGHMSEINVVEGQHVETGDLLGLVGETGAVTGPHLHFEVRMGENNFFATRNPELWLVPPMGWGIIAGRITDSIGQALYDQQIIITDPQNENNWFAWSYGKTTVNSDSYYQENLVIGDIPAGSYILRATFWGMYFNAPVEVHAGMVSYFTFRGYQGFTIGAPPAPGAEFTPVPMEKPIP
jgi:murein DD-endopeptidase MepM/ murein hydrolase activator NlpD